MDDSNARANNRTGDIDSQDELTTVLDQIIKIKRQRQPDSASSEQDVTHEERIKQLQQYKMLEELRQKFQGRVLFEYEDGLATLVREVNA